MFGAALRLYRAQAGAFVVTTAIALLPAHVIKTGLTAVVRYYAAEAPAPDVQPVARSHEGQDRLRARTGMGRPERPPSQATRLERVLGTIADLTDLVDFAGPFGLGDARLVGVLVALSLPFVAAGIYLALAALLPLVLAARRGETATPSEAWALVGARFGALMATDLLAALLIFAGVLALVLPGLALSLLFAFALPAVLEEKVGGIAALRRSLQLTAAVLPRLAGIGLAFVAVRIAAVGLALALLPGDALVRRQLLEDAICVVAFPVPVAALALLYEEARGRQPRAPSQEGAPSVPRVQAPVR